MKTKENINKISECIGLLSSMVNSGESHTSKSKEVIADAKTAITNLEAENIELHRQNEYLRGIIARTADAIEGCAVSKSLHEKT